MHSGRPWPPAYFFGALVCQFIFDFFFPIYRFSSGLSTASGGALVLAGSFLVLTSIWLFKRKNTPVQPFSQPLALIISGPFRWTRNPIYLGMFFALLGIALLQGAGSALIFPFAFFAIINTKIIPEEEAILNAQFGTDYHQYTAKVRRWM